MDKKKFHYLLDKVGLRVESISVVFKNKRRSTEIPFEEIDHITLCDSRYSFFEKLIFWWAKYAFFNRVTGTSPLAEKYEYRYSKGLTVRLKSGKEFFKNVKDFDQISTSRAIEELNQMIKVNQ